MKRKFLNTFMLLAGFTLSLFAGAAHAQTSCRGVLIVNEISNGPSGGKEFVEMIAASCESCSGSTVDISRWIIDDNNGIFSNPSTAAAGSGLGISGGHIRLTNDSLWKNFPFGGLLVLFNATDFDSTNSDFASAIGVPYFVNANGAIFVAVGTSPLVQRKTTTPAASSVDSLRKNYYCDANLYTVDTFSWNTIGLRNGRNGDGIQVRCPGCVTLGEPSFYHGFSYGDTMQHVPSTGFLDGAYYSFDPADTVGGTGVAFQLFQGTDAGADANWRAVPAGSASPGAGNTFDNLDFIDQLVLGLIPLNCCPLPVIDTTPVKGVVMITEFSQGPSGNCEYVELLVSACGGSEVDSVDIRGWIVDDNSGNFNTTRTCASGVGISSGHLRLAYNDAWKKVPVGSVIVLFNGGDNCYNFVDDGADSNHDSIYFVKVGTNVLVERTTTKPSTTACGYCTGAYIVGTNANAWPTVGLGNDKDAIQVRCPGCTDSNPAEPSFYHGIGYGSSFSGFAAGVADLGGAYVSTSGAAKKYEFFQGNVIGLNANWQAATADVAGSVPASAGHVRAGFRDSVTAGLFNFPCCGGSTSGSRITPFDVPAYSTQKSNNVKQGSAFLFPNPAGDQLNITVNRASAYEVKLIDLLGKVVYQYTFNATQGTETIRLNLSEIPKGVYIYNISGGAEETMSGRLMINK